MKRGFVALVAVALLSACGNANQAEPTPGSESTAPDAASAPLAVQAWIEANDVGDCEAVKELVVETGAVDCDEVTSNAGLWSDDITDLATLDHQVEEVVDTSARVHTTHDGQEIGDWDLEWVDGRWLILLSGDDA